MTHIDKLGGSNVFQLVNGSRLLDQGLSESGSGWGEGWKDLETVPNWASSESKGWKKTTALQINTHQCPVWKKLQVL